MKDPNPDRFIFNERLDRTFLDELFEGDSVYAQVVFEDFLRDLPGYWKDVETAHMNRDNNGLRTSVHKCKTLFGYVGFTDIQQLCQQLEDNCSGDQAAQERPHYHLLLTRKDEARQVIENEFKRLKIFNTTC
ncbi:MAG TPA: Hpt domain-containing protein [Puia sp.]|nr:Hpt domain-containing protein [Puia sp.]